MSRQRSTMPASGRKTRTLAALTVGVALSFGPTVAATAETIPTTTAPTTPAQTATGTPTPGPVQVTVTWGGADPSTACDSVTIVSTGGPYQVVKITWGDGTVQQIPVGGTVTIPHAGDFTYVVLDGRRKPITEPVHVTAPTCETPAAPTPVEVTLVWGNADADATTDCDTLTVSSTGEYSGQRIVIVWADGTTDIVRAGDTQTFPHAGDFSYVVVGPDGKVISGPWEGLAPVCTVPTTPPTTTTPTTPETTTPPATGTPTTPGTTPPVSTMPPATGTPTTPGTTPPVVTAPPTSTPTTPATPPTEPASTFTPGPDATPTQTPTSIAGPVGPTQPSTQLTTQPATQPVTPAHRPSKQAAPAATAAALPYTGTQTAGLLGLGGAMLAGGAALLGFARRGRRTH